MQPRKTSTGLKRGQSLIETCLAIVLVCLVFAGLFQVSQLFAAKEVLDYAASRGARAKAVGFNHWVVLKCAKAAAIPNAGSMVTPVYTNVDLTLEEMVDTLKPGPLWDWVMGTADPSSTQYPIERARIPFFLGAPDAYTAYNILDYTDWDSVGVSVSPVSGTSGELLYAKAWQDYPLRIPLHHAFYDDDSVDLQGESYLEQHYALYLEDLGW